VRFTDYVAQLCFPLDFKIDDLNSFGKIRTLSWSAYDEQYNYKYRYMVRASGRINCYG